MAGDSTHWIETDVEKQAPRIKDDRQHHYVGFHDITAVTAYTDLAQFDPNYEADQSILANYPSEHGGPYSPQISP
jgi:hypothetical protein